MNKILKNAYSDLFIFLKKPVDAPTNNRPIASKAKRLFTILLLDISLMAICLLLLKIIESTGLYSTNDNKLNELLKTMPAAVFAILGVLIIPFTEEVIFRLYLRYNTNYLLRFLVSLSFVAGKKNKVRVEAWVKKIWHQQYRYIFYLAALLFGFIHIFNYEYDLKMLILFPLITIPQIVGGILLGYLRVRFNLIWGFFLHALHNAIFLLPVIFLAASANKVEVNDNGQYIKIEKSLLNEKTGMSFYKDSISITNSSLKDIVSATTGYNAQFIESNNENLLAEKYNLYYKNRADSTRLNKTKINEHLTKFCHFELSIEQRSEGVLKLIIEDTLKLNQQKWMRGKGWVRFPKDSAIFHNIPFQALASLLQTPTQKKVFSNDTLQARFNITLQATEPEKLNEQLTSVYGLRLIDSTAEVEHLVIKFNAPK